MENQSIDDFSQTLATVRAVSGMLLPSVAPDTMDIEVGAHENTVRLLLGGIELIIEGSRVTITTNEGWQVTITGYDGLPPAANAVLVAAVMFPHPCAWDIFDMD